MHLIRRFLWRIVIIVTRVVYSARVEGLHHIPERGGALLAGNHESYLDAAMILAWNRRDVRFLISHDVARAPWIAPFVYLTRAIPLVRTLSPRALVAALHAARDAAAAGELIGVFPEGQVTRTGAMLPFRRGYEHVTHAGVPIIPFAVDGAFETIFSMRPGRFRLREMLRRPRIPVTIVFGPQLKHDARPEELRQAVLELKAQAWNQRRRFESPLSTVAEDALRAHPHDIQFIDGNTEHQSANSKLLLRAMIVARHLREKHPNRPVRVHAQKGTEMLTAVLGAIIAARAAEITNSPDEADLTETILEAMHQSAAPFKFPASANLSVDDPALLYRGIAHTHWNILAGSRALLSSYAIGRGDYVMIDASPGSPLSIMGAFAALFSEAHCLWPDTLDSKSSWAARLTHLIARRSTIESILEAPVSFPSLKCVVCFDGTLTAEQSNMLQDRFKITPLHALIREDCGILSTNRHDMLGPKLPQRGTKPGSAGLPVPGIAVKTSASGELLLAGSTIPQGILTDGWFASGLNGHIDADGFIFTTTSIAS